MGEILLNCWILACLGPSADFPTPSQHAAELRKPQQPLGIHKIKNSISSENNLCVTGGEKRHEWGEHITEKGTVYFLVLPVWISIKLASLKLKVTRLAPFHLKCWWGSWHNYQGRHLSQEASLLIADRSLKNLIISRATEWQQKKQSVANRTQHTLTHTPPLDV